MQKRGLSEIVSTVLLVMLVLAAVVIVWALISQILKPSEESTIETQLLTVGFTAKSVVEDELGNVNFVLERTAGGGKIDGFIIALEDSNGK